MPNDNDPLAGKLDALAGIFAELRDAGGAAALVDALDGVIGRRLREAAAGMAADLAETRREADECRRRIGELCGAAERIAPADRNADRLRAMLRSMERQHGALAAALDALESALNDDGANHPLGSLNRWLAALGSRHRIEPPPPFGTPAAPDPPDRPGASPGPTTGGDP